MKRRGCSRAERRLGWLTWLIMAAGVGTDLAVTGSAEHPNRLAVSIFCMIFFGVLVLRLVVALSTRTRGRLGLIVLTVGMVSWAAESTLLQNAQQAGHGAHLASGEWAYLITYLVFAVWVLIDSEHRPAGGLSTWLETAVVCGGTASLAGTLLLTPFVAQLPDSVSLLVALVYPVADAALALLVLAQVCLRMRSRDHVAVQICCGFLLLAVADASFVGNVVHGSEGSTVLSIVLWGAGFAQLVSAACRRPPEEAIARAEPTPATVLVTASLVAICVLVLRPGDALGAYLAGPAVVTLLAAGGRMLVALRDARGATEAFAQARTDDLTMLPNRRAMLLRIEQDQAADRPLALILMDLNGFKDINDTLGHAAGDVILQMCARRMRSALPAKVTVARLGGDEFALVTSETDELRLLELANVALTAVREPTVAHGIELVVEAALGIAVRHPGERDSSALMRRADVAMYQAKQLGTGALMYDASRDDFSLDRLRMVEELRRAIADGQLVLWYQPQVHAATQEICGLEALVRWQHPTRGILPPVAFLAAVRHAGMMPALSEAIISLAAKDMRAWQTADLGVRVALNCPPPELLSGTFVRRLLRTIETSRLEPASFVIEVTEDSFLHDPERARRVVEDIRDEGLEISIDDFGTGFSSLAYLRDLPIDELKIDRSFISTMTADRRSREIVDSTVKMAHALGLRIVAEGVEDAATAAALVAMGADELQGYHFSRPMPADQVIGWVTERRASLSGALDL